jgi:small subunit ribosomal protein S1
MGWSRVSEPDRLFKPGDEVTVKVLRVDAVESDKQKISLGLKQLMQDPWSKVQGTYAIGQVHTGRFTRIADFGAFVELEAGVEALAHASTFAPTGGPGGWKGQVAPGTTGAFEILNVDVEKRRIGVALLPEGSARAGGGTAKVIQDAREADEVQEYIERENAAPSERFGSLADKLRGALKRE